MRNSGCATFSGLSLLTNPLSEIEEYLDKRQRIQHCRIGTLSKEFTHWYKITEKQSPNSQGTALDNQCLNP